jgi:hypothetical protein
MVRLRVLSFLLALISFMFASQASAQTAVMKQFSQFGGGGQGLYWVPSSGPISPIAFWLSIAPATIWPMLRPRNYQGVVSAFSA